MHSSTSTLRYAVVTKLHCCLYAAVRFKLLVCGCLSSVNLWLVERLSLSISSIHCWVDCIQIWHVSLLRSCHNIRTKNSENVKLTPTFTMLPRVNFPLSNCSLSIRWKIKTWRPIKDIYISITRVVMFQWLISLSEILQAQHSCPSGVASASKLTLK